MTWNNKVVWSEGMFLRPQHFQQQDRYFENLIKGQCQYLRPYDWGIGKLTLDQEALALGKVAIAACQGLLPDNTPINIPDDDTPPPPLDIDPDARDVRVFLALPLRRLGMPEVNRNSQQEVVRYRTIACDVRDNVIDTANNMAPLEIGNRNMRLMLEQGDHSEYATIGIARVVEKLPDQTVILDNEFIPPCLDCQSVPSLKGFINEIFGLLHQRGDALAERLTVPGRGGLETAQFLRLQLINRFEPLFAHLANMNGLHPEDFYQTALQLAGELATFSSKTKRRPLMFPAYEHDDLQKTFKPVMEELRRSLSLVEEQTAIQIPLEERKFGIRVGIISDRERKLLSSANFILAVHADIPLDTLRNRFPAQVKIGPVERIAQFVNHHLPGIGLSALPVAPREIPYHADYVYFRLDRSSEFWKQLLNSGGFAFHVAGEFPGIDMTFWAIRE